MSEVHRLELQVCASCGVVQYPDREVCRACLGGELERRPVPDGGELVSWTRLHVSLDPLFRDRLPWLIASIRLGAGPVVISHWVGPEPAVGQAARVVMIDDPAGRRVLAALDRNADEAAAARLFTASPSGPETD